MSIFRPALHLLVICILTACGGGPVKKSDTAEGHYNYAKALADEERFEESLREYQEMKNKHPYSRYAVQAELDIADIHYERESYIEAQTAYEIFKSLHPNHEENARVTFRIGMSYYHQLPSTIDRDLSLASKAIFHFDQVLASYPNSDFAKEALQKREEIRKMLAEKELYIARFYLQREQYGSALGRFEALLDSFPDAVQDEALYGASLASFKSGSRGKGEKYFQQLQREYPESAFTQKAREELKKYVDR
jgi:outer membrane protein assembly factor BamD